ncbi:helix-turn-helix domain-containing protein, partial [Lapillicoccus sp.]|uniref:helix-turn-helix domain-containing protein n=1 Tax=Lapillicoccus sp. TaxID=1909287 RepID=UPI0032642571
EPLLHRVGGRVVTDAVASGDVEVGWPGGPTVRVRLDAAAASTTISANPDSPSAPAEPASLSDGLARLIADVERELGGDLADLARDGKQRAVRLLEERGAFEMRRSAETVAQALGVTRFTVYNYLNRAGRSSA